MLLLLAGNSLWPGRKYLWFVIFGTLRVASFQIILNSIQLVMLILCLTRSLPEYLTEFCNVTLTFESVDEILWCDHSWNVSACTYTWCYLFFKISQNIIWKFGRNLLLAKLGSERVKTSYTYNYKKDSLNNFGKKTSITCLETWICVTCYVIMGQTVSVTM